MLKFKEYLNNYLGTTDPNTEDWHGPAREKLKEQAGTLHRPGKLSKDEISSVKNYSEFGYSPINNHHRGLPIKTEDILDYPERTIKHHTKHLDSAISKHATQNPIHVWRGITQDVVDNFKKGRHHIDKGYVSTTINPSSAAFFAGSNKSFTHQHIAHIKVPKGSKALYLEQQGLTHNPGEHEVLLPRNSRFHYEGSEEVKKTDNANEDSWMVHHFTHIPKNIK